MPELPEVETVKNGLAPVMRGQAIDDVWCGEKGLRQPFPSGLESRLSGARIGDLSRRAKYILVPFKKEEDRLLVIHLGMSGRIKILRPGANDPPETHDHFKLTLKDRHQIIMNDARRFGMVFDLKVTELSNHSSFHHLGPEPLSQDFTAQYLEETLNSKATPIKTAIMDQRIVVGVGNIYACEALYRSGISPKRKANTVKGLRAKKLVQAIKDVLLEAIASGGSSLKDHRTAYGEFGYFQQKLQVYSREGLACPHCTCDIAQTGGIERYVQSGRSTFACGRMQR